MIAYELARSGHVTIKALLDDFRSASGEVVWDATDERGQGVAAGVYMYTMRTNDIELSKKILLLDGRKKAPETQEASTAPNVPTIIIGRRRRLIIMAQ